jgi:hypothetical protein
MVINVREKPKVKRISREIFAVQNMTDQKQPGKCGIFQMFG